jgi:SAM-dependent methyltransferase
MAMNVGFWDERYAEPGFAYGREPNRFLRRRLAAMQPGRLLLPGEGEGRNAVWAAEQGWQVTALDQSEVAVEKIRRHARERSVEVDARRVDLAAGVPDDLDGFDAIALIYVHLDPEIRTRVHRELARRLTPGGVLLVEAFAPDQLGRPSGGPPRRELLVNADDLTADLAGVVSLRAVEELEVTLDEGRYHRGLASVVRLVARAPSIDLTVSRNSSTA